MKANETLLSAIGGIDEKFIAEAEKPTGIRIPIVYKVGALAAALVITFAAVLFAAKSMGIYDGFSSNKDMGGSGNSAPEFDDTADGVTGSFSSEFGTLSYLGEHQGSYRFILNITGEVEKIEVTLIGITADGAVPTEEFEIKINGKSADEFPTSLGEYYIDIAVRESAVIEKIYFSGFGEFDIKN